jgi:hypothetical protein
MERQIAFCSACDRDVQIVITDSYTHDGHANLQDSEIVCLEIGDQCTGTLCPFGAMSSAVMAARLVRNGLQSSMEATATFTCARCECVTRHVLIGHSWATCCDCGATRSQRSPADRTN